MRKLVLFSILATAVVAGTGLGYIFKNYNRYGNPAAAKPRLTIYTHSSFMDVYGPGPELSQKFESLCRCTIDWVDAGSGQMILEKLKLAPEKPVDLILGFDKPLLKAAATSVRFKKVKAPELQYADVFIKNRFKNFLPYNWSPLTFITTLPKPEEQNFFEFIDELPNWSLSVPSPAASTPGLQLAMFLFDLSNRSEEKYRQNLLRLAPKIGFQGPDWSASYGAFQKGQTSFGWSFLSSLLYHWEQKEDPVQSYSAIVFEQGHPVHLDYLAIPERCISCGIAQSFVDYILSPEGQEIIVRKNYMLSILEVASPAADRLPSVTLSEYQKMDELVDQRDLIIQLWNEVIR